MIGKLQEGRTVTSVSAEIEINESVVSRTWEAFQTTGTAVNKYQKRFLTRFDLVRDRDPRFYTSNIKERHRYGGPGVLVWGGIMLNRRTELYIFDRGSVTGDRYCEEILLPHVHLFRGAIDPDFIFMDDNARSHRTLAVEELLESEDITRMDWPAYSPDLNPMEHVWGLLGRRIVARLHHTENTQQLKQMLIEERALQPQEMLHQLVLSMRRRVDRILYGLRVTTNRASIQRKKLYLTAPLISLACLGYMVAVRCDRAFVTSQITIPKIPLQMEAAMENQS
ncbi:transposable element Tcb2 transposase [Trichonephila clavipes]|nr:transposable element Tcb2 transposase [Trichonephila clavipes]